MATQSPRPIQASLEHREIKETLDALSEYRPAQDSDNGQHYHSLNHNGTEFIFHTSVTDNPGVLFCTIGSAHQHVQYLIVGAGCFGASTALHLKRTKPQATVILLDRTQFPCASAAAHDLNKIIRTEYADPLYMKLALEAQDIWRSDAIFQPYFHETGIIFAGSEESGTAVLEAYKRVTGTSPAELIDPENAKERFGGVFREADWSPVTKCTWNPRAGWGEAEIALRSIIQAAVDLGVENIAAPVAKVSFDGDGTCQGVESADGHFLTSDYTILCTGAYTAELLADSAPESPSIQVGGRMVAAAAIMYAFKVPQDEMAKFETAPIIVSPVGDYPGESIPAGPLGLVKCTHELSFTNNAYHEASKQTISVPPRHPTQMIWSHDVPQGLKDEVAIVKQNIYGDWIKGLEPEYYRMCWDAVTPNQDFVICSHPHSKNLYIAGGGSFHGWKFLANIGKYVVQMLDGQLDEDTAVKWAWDRDNAGAACGVYLPSRDLSDIR